MNEGSGGGGGRRGRTGCRSRRGTGDRSRYCGAGRCGGRRGHSRGRSGGDRRRSRLGCRCGGAGGFGGTGRGGDRCADRNGRPAGLLRGGRGAGDGRAAGLQLGEVAEVLLQFGHAGAGLLLLAALGHLGFAGARLDGALGELELVRRCRCGGGFLHLRLHAAAGFAAARAACGGGRGGGQAAAEVVEVAALHGHQATRLGRADRLRLLGAGQVDHGAGAQPVDVAADEGVGVGAQQGDQQLVERDPIGFLRGDEFGGRVAGADGDGAGGRAGHARDGHRRCRPRHRDRCRGGGRLDRLGGSRCRCLRCGSGGRRRGGRSGRGSRNLRGQRGRRGCGAQMRRIEQQGVVAREAAGGPVGLQDQVEVGLVDAAVAANAQIAAAVSPLLQAHQCAGECGVVVHPRGAECGGGCDVDGEAGCFVGADFDHVHVGLQGLAEGGEHRDASQPQCISLQGQHRAHGQERRQGGSAQRDRA